MKWSDIKLIDEEIKSKEFWNSPLYELVKNLMEKQGFDLKNADNVDRILFWPSEKLKSVDSDEYLIIIRDKPFMTIIKESWLDDDMSLELLMMPEEIKEAESFIKFFDKRKAIRKALKGRLVD